MRKRQAFFFYRDRFTDFELRFIVPHQMLFGPGGLETSVNSSLHEWGMTRKSEPASLCLCQSGELARCRVKDGGTRHAHTEIRQILLSA